MLNEAPVLRSSCLPEHFRVSPMTIWRDLVALEENGLIKRGHGRIARAGKITEPDFQAKTVRSQSAKRAIAAFAAKQFIQPGDSLVIDGGTTVAAIAEQPLPDDLSILTNSIHTARLFLNHPSRPGVYCCGGLLRPQSGTFIGREALSFFSRRKVKRYFLSATGIDPDAGITDLTLEDNEVKQAMAAAASEVILLADRTKFGLVSLMEVLPWTRISHLITDATLSDLAPFESLQDRVQIHLA